MTLLEQRYELGPRLGVGGMAEVVEAYDRRLDRRVAVKLLRDGTGDARAHERFVREAQMAAGFTHPNVVTVFDVGEANGRPYLVMELVEGRTLAEVLRRRGALPVDEAMVVEDGILAALSAAHAQGLVHRDVKPGNVLLSRDGRVKLADFGIAKATRAIAADLTATGEVLGTPTYLAPEQLDGGDATPRSDVYAAGVVLYEMLAGVPPFQGDNAWAVATAHRDAPVPPLSGHRDDVPPALGAVVDRALEKSPGGRFADAEAMRAAMRGRVVPRDAAPTQRVDPVTQTLPAAIESTPAPPRRRWGRVLAVLIVLALLGGAAAALLLRDDGGPDVAAVDPTTTTEATTTTTTLPPTTTTTLPSSLSGLLGLVAANPAAYGERGGDLVSQLSDVLSKPDDSGRRPARLSEQISQWVEDGQLDPTMGALAQQLLAPYVAVPGEQGGKRWKGD